VTNLKQVGRVMASVTGTVQVANAPLPVVGAVAVPGTVSVTGTVEVANTPLSVKVVNQVLDETQPVVVDLGGLEQIGGTYFTAQEYAVPSGKRLVIEQVFCAFTSNPGSGATASFRVWSPMKEFPLIVVYQGQDSVSRLDEHAVSQRLTLYAFPGETVDIELVPLTSSANLVGTRNYFSGYLEPHP
jgi:hypothetical protein